MAYVCIAQHNMRCRPLFRPVSYRLYNFLRRSYLCWPRGGDLSYVTNQTVSAHPKRLIHRDACAIFFAVHWPIQQLAGLLPIGDYAGRHAGMETAACSSRHRI